MAIASSIIAAGIGAAGALGSAAIGAGGAKSAAKAQMKMYQQTRADLAPYMTTGTSALNQIAKLWGLGPGGSGIPDTGAMMTALENFPGYQFGLQQGIKGLDQSAASRGLLLSGAQLEDAQKFG